MQFDLDYGWLRGWVKQKGGGLLPAGMTVIIKLKMFYAEQMYLRGLLKHLPVVTGLDRLG
jgi:hypothetical protein